MDKFLTDHVPRASDEDPIPVFLSRCLQFIESEGVATEGLYRVPGNRSVIA